MSCYAFRLAPCDLGDPGWGDPWFPHGAVLLPSPACMALCVFFSVQRRLHGSRQVVQHVLLHVARWEYGLVCVCVLPFFGNFCGHTIMR